VILPLIDLRGLFAATMLGFAAVTTPAALAQGGGQQAAADEAHAAALADWRAGRSEEARPGFERACDLGSIAGCASVARMMAQGNGGPEDLPRAVALYSKACDGGHAQACLSLGLMLQNGQGGPADRVQAKARFDDACRLGQRLACKLAAKP